MTGLFRRAPAPVLQPTPDVPWASGALFNPGAALGDDGVLRLLARGVPAGHRRVEVQHADEHEPRFGFETYVSALGLATRGPDGRFALDAEPLLAPSGEVDRFGCEDARVTRLNGRWWITYTALAEPAATATWGVGIALASTDDWKTVERHGRIGPAVRDKDAALFPRPIGGRIAMFHRIAPDVQLVWFEDEGQMLAPGARFWERELAALDRNVVLRPERTWEAKKVGTGPPPVETPDGWLVVYHAADAAHVYRAGLALLDLDDPTRVVARTRGPVLEPELDFELHGDVPHVVFPQGATVEDGPDGRPALNLYY
ncbi:MAG TPA: glycosidase, partial [Rubricoccaceae bacterium]